MVKKTFLTFAAALVLTLVGCNQLPSSARPNNASGLTLSVPAPEGISSKFTLLTPVLLYRVVSASEVFSGSVSYSQLASLNGPLNLNLPHDGRWLISAEWLLNGLPAQIGAGVVTVSGNTPFALEMGSLNSTCYMATIANPGSNAGVPDTFNFDNNVVAYSPVSLGPTPDIQALWSSPVTSMYLQAYPSPQPNIAYLGTGHWVDYTAIPPSTVFYNDSLAAKQAALGPAAVMEVDDVYAVKLSATTTAWLQVRDVVNVGATYVQFDFRLNRHGFPYMKFDVTAFGDTNCNTSGNILY
ncbi:MAG TPA: hypothetical protein VHE12_00175 [bacterium]|nr:hypothetical protein [bacterium]